MKLEEIKLDTHFSGTRQTIGSKICQSESYFRDPVYHFIHSPLKSLPMCHGQAIFLPIVKEKSRKRRAQYFSTVTSDRMY